MATPGSMHICIFCRLYAISHERGDAILEATGAMAWYARVMPGPRSDWPPSHLEDLLDALAVAGRAARTEAAAGQLRGWYRQARAELREARAREALRAANLRLFEDDRPDDGR